MLSAFAIALPAVLFIVDPIGVVPIFVALTGNDTRERCAAIARGPRSGARPEDASLQRAIADDLALGFDPLACDPAVPWTGPRPAILAALSAAPWRSAGDTVERIEMLATRLIADSLCSNASFLSVIPAKAGIHRKAWA